VFNGIVLPTLRQVVVAERSLALSTRSSAETFQFNDSPRSVQTLSIASDDSDDYDSWEIRCNIGSSGTPSSYIFMSALTPDYRNGG